MDHQEMMGLLKEIADGAEKAEWKAVALPIELLAKDSTIKSYSGNVGDWAVTVVSFGTEDQGFPKGSRGFDGTGMRLGNEKHGGTVLRLTRELAERLFLLAEKKK